MIDLQAAAERLNGLNRAADAAAAERKREAAAEGLRLARLIGGSDPGVEKVWGFGSVYEEGRPFTMDSDIDLAVEGGELFSLLRLAERSPFKVDLIDIGGRSDGFAALLRSRAVLLYSR